MKHCIMLLAWVVASASAAAAGEIVKKRVDAGFEEAKDALVLAIENRGLVVSYVAHVGEMLDRTGIYVHFGMASIEASFPLEVRLDGYLQLEREMSTSQRDFDAVAPARGTPLALPEPWQAREFIAIKRGPGSDQLFRAVVPMVTGVGN